MISRRSCTVIPTMNIVCSCESRENRPVYFGLLPDPVLGRSYITRLIDNRHPGPQLLDPVHVVFVLNTGTLQLGIEDKCQTVRDVAHRMGDEMHPTGKPSIAQQANRSSVSVSQRFSI